MASEKINKTEFEKLTKKYQKKNAGKTRAVIMDRESFERILANKEVKKVAIYFGETDANEDTVAVVGLNEKGTLLFDSAENRGGLCPPNCPPDEQ